jgi:carbon storage regulator
MLVLTRKKNQSIIIGNNIEIKILKMTKNAIEIGINAPKNLSIYREEVFKEIQKKNIEASRSLTVNDINSIKNVIKKIKK